MRPLHESMRFAALQHASLNGHEQLLSHFGGKPRYVIHEVFEKREIEKMKEKFRPPRYEGIRACFTGFEPALRRGSLLYGQGACHQFLACHRVLSLLEGQPRLLVKNRLLIQEETV